MVVIPHNALNKTELANIELLLLRKTEWVSKLLCQISIDQLKDVPLCVLLFEYETF